MPESTNSEPFEAPAPPDVERFAATDLSVASLGASAPASRRAIVKNFAGVAGIGLISRAVAILLDVYVRRTLGLPVMGMIEWNGAALAYCGVLGNPGLQSIARREAAKSPQRIAELLLKTALLQIGPLLLVLGACIAVKAMGYRPGAAGTLLVLQAVNTLLIATTFRWAFEAVDRYIVGNVLSLIALLMTALCAVLMVRTPEHCVRYILIQIASTSFLLTLMFALAFRSGVLTVAAARTATRTATHNLWRIYRQAFSLTATALTTIVYVSTPVLLLGICLDSRSVGLYTTAYGLMLLGTVAGVTFSSVYFPSLVRSAAQADARGLAAKVSLDLFRAVLITTAPVGLLGWALGRHVVALVYGETFAPVGPYFEWFCVFLIFASFDIGLGSPLVPWGFNRLYFRIGMASAACNLALGAVLIPIYGVAGAVGAMVAAEGVAAIVAVRVRSRIYPIAIQQFLLPFIPMVLIAVAARYAAGVRPSAALVILAITVSLFVFVIGISNRQLVGRAVNSLRR